MIAESARAGSGDGGSGSMTPAISSPMTTCRLGFGCAVRSAVPLSEMAVAS
jgi:hypothetical protein